MSKPAPTVRRNPIASRILIAGAAASCASMALWGAVPVVRAETAAAAKIPDLASIEFAWLALGVHWFDPPPGLGRGPIRQDPAYRYHSNVDGPGQVTPDLGYTKDPVLKTWAAKEMQESNEEVLTGRRGLPFAAQSVCYPGGVPGQLLTPAEPFYFIQKPQEVWMIWQRDHMVRRIYLTDKHSQAVKPSWFGESIGHYESDGTLVVDTVGLSAHLSYLDWYRTPHTEKEQCRRALQADQRRQPPGSPGGGRGPRHIQRAALHDPALAQGEKPDAGDGLRGEQWRSFREESVSDSAGEQAGFLTIAVYLPT
jgi:hypothetical protein